MHSKVLNSKSFVCSLDEQNVVYNKRLDLLQDKVSDRLNQRNQSVEKFLNGYQYIRKVRCNNCRVDLRFHRRIPELLFRLNSSSLSYQRKVTDAEVSILGPLDSEGIIYPLRPWQDQHQLP